MHRRETVVTQASLAGPVLAAMSQTAALATEDFDGLICGMSLAFAVLTSVLVFCSFNLC